jgi:hypothetical protein
MTLAAIIADNIGSIWSYLESNKSYAKANHTYMIDVFVKEYLLLQDLLGNEKPKDELTHKIRSEVRHLFIQRIMLP